METMSKALNGVWQGYLLAVGWVSAAGKWVAENSHKCTWAIIIGGIGYALSWVL